MHEVEQSDVDYPFVVDEKKRKKKKKRRKRRIYLYLALNATPPSLSPSLTRVPSLSPSVSIHFWVGTDVFSVLQLKLWLLRFVSFWECLIQSLHFRKNLWHLTGCLMMKERTPY